MNLHRWILPAIVMLLVARLAVAPLSAQSAGPSRSSPGQPPVKRAHGKARPAPASATSQPVANQELLEDLSTAYRILAKTGVVDAYGHASVRNPANPNHYFMQRNLPPALSTVADLVEYDLDSKPVAADAPPGFTERYIHGEIYRARPDVMAVVHFHAPEVIPFAVAGVPLRPVYHMAGFLGVGVPVFEIRQIGVSEMLIRNPELGQALAKALGDKPLVLLRGHGAVAVAPSLHVAVGRAYYATMNARLQAQAMQMSANLLYLSPEEARNTAAQDGFERAWTLWKSEVGPLITRK